MTQSTPNIAALIGSRICHDLISPVGAVSNGLELLEMTGSAKSPEMSLVSESAASASARIRLFRIAFGASSEGQQVAAQEVGDILETLYAEARTDLRWQVRGSHDRTLMKAALLALLCVENAVPGNGTITVSLLDNRWSVRAEAARLTRDPALWALFNGAPIPDDLPPAAVQFALLPELLEQLGRKAKLQDSQTELEMAF